MRPFALWLMPAAPDQERLERIIVNLARAHGGPVFPPHLTLYGSQSQLPENWCERLPELVKGCQTTSIKINELTFSEVFFRTMVLELTPNDLCDTLFHRAKSADFNPSGYVLRPHVSLFYGKLEGSLLCQLQREWEAKLPGELCFDRVRLVAPASPEYRWERVSTWRTLGECGLA